MSVSTTSSANVAEDTDYRVLVPGMNRSASTWLYNVARLLISQHVGSDFSCGWIGDIKTIPRRRHMLIKTHAYNSTMIDWSTFILYSYRDIRDVVASLSRKYGILPSIESADQLVSSYHKWVKIADFVVPYDAILGDKELIVNSLAEKLAIRNFNPSQIVQEIAGMSYDSEGRKNEHYHEVNLYHQGHMTDGRVKSWDGHVDPELICKIEYNHQDWFENCGFPVENR